MAECFTFGGRESTRIVLGNIKDTSSNVLLLLLPLVVFFLSLSLFVNFVLGSQQARDKKKNTKHKTPIRAKSTQYLFCMHAADICRSSLWRTILCFAFLLCPVPVCSLSNLAARHPRISKMSTNQTHIQNGKRRIERREGHSLGAPLSIEIPYMLCLVFLTTMTTVCPSMPLSSAVTNPSPARL
jgi:hypothetical protein